VFAYILSLLLYPLAIFLNKNIKINKTFAALLSCIIFISIVIFLSKTIVYKIFSQGQYFLSNIPIYTKEFLIKVEQTKLRYRKLINLIPQKSKQNILEYMKTNLTGNFINKILQNSSSSLVKFVPKFFFNTIVMMIATFFFVKDKILIEKFLVKSMPKRIIKTLKQLRKGCLQGLITYVKSEMILMCVTATICTIGYTLIGYPYALFLGLTTGLIDSLPIFGTGIIIWPWAIYNFLNNDYQKTIILLITYGISIISRNILSPKLIGKQIGVHPLVMLISIYIGLKVLGIFGVVIGPIIIITAKIIREEIKDSI
jgi:sporulation integral membrane protein YtvI